MSIKISCKPWVAGLNIEFKYAHLKRDGIYLRVNCASKQVWTSKPTNITEDVSWVRGIDSLLQNNNALVVLGELFCVGKPASYVKTAIIERNPDLRFEAFAIENAAENAPLEAVCKTIEALNCHFIPYINLMFRAARQESNCESFILEDELSKYIDAEGWVLKNGNLLDFYKWKPVKTVDCVVTGFVAGKGKYLGMVGALVVSLYTDTGIVEVAAVGGFTDEEREAISADCEGCLGRVVEVEYQYVGSGGRLRHPRFKRWRDDKLSSECTTEQDAAWSYLDD